MGRRKATDELCGICNKLSSNDSVKVDDWLKCDSCSSWCHAGCCSISSNDELLILKSKNKWFCPVCIRDSNFSHLSNKIVSSINMSSAAISQGSQPIDYQSLIELEMKKMWPIIYDEVKRVIKENVLPITVKLEARISELEQKLSNQENSFRAKNLIFNGLPLIDDSDTTSLSKIASEIGLVNFSLDWIDYTRRFTGVTPNKPTNLLVRFSTLFHRNTFMNAYIKYIKNRNVSLKCILPDLPNGFIYVNEHLKTSIFKLYMEARALVRDKKIWKTTIRKNNVTIQPDRGSTPIIILNHKDLAKYNAVDNNFRSSTPTNNKGSISAGLSSMSFHSSEDVTKTVINDL